MFLIWMFAFLSSGAKNFTYLRLQFFLSGALNFSYLELRSLFIWGFDFSYLGLRMLISGALILFSSRVLFFSYLEL